MRNRILQRLIEQFVALATVEPLDEAALLGLARRDLMSAHTAFVRQGQDHIRDVCGAVVADARGRAAPALTDYRIEFERDTPTRQGETRQGRERPRRQRRRRQHQRQSGSNYANPRPPNCDCRLRIRPAEPEPRSATAAALPRSSRSQRSASPNSLARARGRCRRRRPGSPAAAAGHRR